MGKGDKNHKRRKTKVRTPSGQPSRAKHVLQAKQADAERQRFEEGAQQVVLQARRRRLGIISDDPVTREEAAKLALFDRGNPLGDWLADGYLTRGHIEVAGDYAVRHRRYTRLCGLPKPTPKIGAYKAATGVSCDPDPDPDDAARARRAHMEDQAALRRCSPGVRDQMYRACILMEPATLRWVREGIEALADLHGVELDKPKKQAT
jgi:hypothetical protein